MDVAHNRIPVSKSALLILTAVLLLAAPRIALAQTISVSSSSVSLSGTEGGYVSVTSSDSSTVIAYTATVSASTPSGWLSINGGYPSGTTPTFLTFQESYCPSCSSASATITLTATSPSSIAGTTTTINVTWTPQGGGGGGGGTGTTTITPSTTSVTWSNSGGTTSSTSVSLTTGSTTGISYSLYTSVNWLTVTPTTGTVYSTSPVSLALQFSSSGLQAGTQTGYIYITYGSTTFTITVTFTVINSNLLTISPTTASWGYSTGGTVPYTDIAVTSGTTYISAISNASWILLTWPTAPSTYSPQSSLQYVQATLGIRAIYNTSASIPSSGTTGSVTITDTNGNTSTFTATFTGGGSTGSGNVTLSPSSVTLTCSAGAGSGCAQTTVSVSSTVSGTLSATSSLGNYVTPTLGSNSIAPGYPVTITLYGNASGLSSQTYSGTLYVSVLSNGTTYQSTVPISFVVGSSTSTPNLLVAPSTLSFSADVNNPASISPQYLTVADAGNYTASVTNGSQWLTLGATSGYSSGTASPALLEVIASPSGLTAGTYTGTVSVSSSSGTTPISVTLQVYSSATIYATTAIGSGGSGSLNITEVAGNISGSVPNVYVYSSNSSVMSVQASTSTSWLEVIPASGTTPNAQFNIIFLASSLTNGVYVGTVTFTSTSSANATLTVPVVLTVASSAVVSGLTLTQNSLSMSSTVNGTSMSQQLGITSTTATSFTVSSNAAWLTLNTSSGTATSSTTYITATASPSGLTAGTYSGTITVTGGGSTATASVTFTVSSSGSTGGGNVVSSPTSLTFSYQINSGSLPASQSLTISNATSGTSQILFTVAVNSAAAGWLTATAGGGGTQAYTQSTVTVSVTPGSLSAATYSGTVTITPSGSGSILSIPVTLNILGPPAVTATPSSLTFAYQAGGTIPPSQAVQVSGSTSGLTYSVTPTMTSGANWLVVSKTSGTTGSTGQDVLSVSVTPTNLAAAAAYQGTILIQGTGNASGSATISVVLTVTAPAPTITSVQHAASFVSGAVAPGEIVSIFGTAMGPASPLGTTIDSTGKVATTLGNVTVLFNGYASPLTYVSATQINCVVPYEVAQLSSPYVEVKYLNQTSQTVSLRAVTTVPGIFTLANGTGQGAFLNYDNSYNNASHPAAAGSTIQLYLTGEGQLSPAGVTGSVTCSAGCATVNQIPLPLLPVAALVNNQPATIAFAREAPGDVSGVMQVNVVIPPNTPSGPISIAISVGGNSTQSGVTVYVQ